MSSVKELFAAMNLSTDQVEKPAIVQQWLEKRNSSLSSFINGSYLGSGVKTSVKTPSGLAFEVTCASEDELQEAITLSKNQSDSWLMKDVADKTRVLYAVARNFQKHVNLFATSEAVTYPFKRAEECRGSCATYSVEYLYTAASRKNFKNLPPKYETMITVQSEKCTPINLIAEWKVGESLTANTPVLLAVTPNNCLPALVFAEICAVAGLPSGLINVLILPESTLSSITAPPSVLLHRLHENQAHLSTCIILEGADVASAVNGAIEMLTDCWGMPNYFGVSLYVHECIEKNVMKVLEAQIGTLKVASSNFNKTADLISAKSAKVVRAAHVHGGSNTQPTIFVQFFRTLKEVSSLVSTGTMHSENVSIWTEYVGRAVEVANRVSGYRNLWINGQNLYDIDMDSLKELYYPSGDVDLNEKIHRAKSAVPDTGTEHVFSNIDRTLKLYSGGAQKRSEGNSCYPVFNRFPPFDRGDKVLAYAPAAGAKDTRDAVEAALKAFPGWSSKSAFNRSQILYFFGENLSQRRNELVEKLSQNTGHSDCEKEMQECIDTVFKWAGLCDQNAPSFTSSSGMKVYSSHEPLGVVGIVCPPIKSMSSLITLLVSAISIGNTVVLLVPEEYPIAPLMLAQVIETSDIPAGVINILSGPTDGILGTLARHHDVNALWCWSNRKTDQLETACEASGKESTWWFNISSKNARIWTDREIDFYRGSRKYVWLPFTSVFAN